MPVISGVQRESELRAHRVALVVAACIGVLVGCTTVSVAPSQSPTVAPPIPSQTSTPTSPAPTATPSAAAATASATALAAPTSSVAPASPAVDVATVFVTELASTKDFNSTISGMFQLGNLQVPVSGDMTRAANGDSAMHEQFTIGTTAKSTAEIDIGDTQYVSTDGGPFVAHPGGASSGSPLVDPTKIGTSLASLQNAGLVDHDGRQLYELKPSADLAIGLQDLGLGDTFPNAQGGVDFFAEQDGTPAVMEITASWQQPEGTTTLPATLLFDFDFKDWGQPVTVSAPSNPWSLYSSTKLQMTAGMPPGYTSSSLGKNDDKISLSDWDYFFVWSHNGYTGGDLQTFAAQDDANIEKAWANSGYSLSQTGSKDTMIDNKPAHITYLSDSTNHVSMVSSLTIGGDRGYEMEYVRDADMNLAIQTYFDQFATTVKLGTPSS
jgi:hypothetical protein